MLRSRNQTSPQSRFGWLPHATRTFLLLTAGAVLLAACGGDDDDNAVDDNVVAVATFTPVPPGWTPTVDPTIVAGHTQVAEMRTATASAPTPTPGPTQPPSTPSIDGEVVYPTPPSTRPNVVYPPGSVLISTGDRYVGGTVGSYNWFDPELESGGSFQAPWIEISAQPVVAAAGDGATILFEEDAPVPVSTEVQIFTAKENSAIPTTTEGVPSNKPAFVRQTDPVLTTTVEGASPSFFLDVPPGDYLVLATVTWPRIEELGEYADQMTQYLYWVTVE